MVFVLSEESELEEEPEVAEVAEAEVEEVVEVTNVEAATVAPGDAEPVAVCVAAVARSVWWTITFSAERGRVLTCSIRRRQASFNTKGAVSVKDGQSARSLCGCR